MKNRYFFAAVITLVLTACGGGGDSATVSDSVGYTVESGVAQKGPLAQGSAIWVNELAATTYKPNGKEYTFRTTNDFGTFAPSGITYGTPYLSTLAQGYYYNEITGTQSDDIVLLSGLSQIGAEGDTAADTAINVNVLSSMAVNRVTRLATTAPKRTFSFARAKAQKETLGAFYIYNDASILSGKKVGGVAQPANLTALDLSKSRAADQILAAVSAVVMKAGVNGAGVNVLLSQTASDLEDDGLLNNSTNYRTSVQSKLCAAAAVTDFADVAKNLNSFYGTSYSAIDLSQWVDTSGCADQVIDKYKFTANNVAVGTVSKSPAYITGADDIGQCFSVGSLNGASGGLYVGTATTPSTIYKVTDKDTRLSVGLTASAAGAASGFIQRFTPTSSACPATFPTSVTLVKVQKYSISSSGSINADPQGLWSIANFMEGLGGKLGILENGETWGLFLRDGDLGAAYYGTTTVSVNEATITLKEFSFGDGILPPNTVSLALKGTIVPKSSLALSAENGTGTLTYDSLYDKPATAAAIAGKWSLGVQITRNGKIDPLFYVAIDVDIAGAFTVNDADCIRTGSIVPRPGGKGVYNGTISIAGTGCGGNMVVSGVGYVDTSVSPNKFVLILSDAAKSGAIVLGGTKQ